jgi:hypothetical protein
MEKKKNSSSHERREVFYPSPQIKNKLQEFAKQNEMTKSEVVNLAVKMMLNQKKG